MDRVTRARALGSWLVPDPRERPTHGLLIDERAPGSGGYVLFVVREDLSLEPVADFHDLDAAWTTARALNSVFSEKNPSRLTPVDSGADVGPATWSSVTPISEWVTFGSAIAAVRIAVDRPWDLTLDVTDDGEWVTVARFRDAERAREAVAKLDVLVAGRPLMLTNDRAVRERRAARQAAERDRHFGGAHRARLERAWSLWAPGPPRRRIRPILGLEAQWGLESRPSLILIDERTDAVATAPDLFALDELGDVLDALTSAPTVTRIGGRRIDPDLIYLADDECPTMAWTAPSAPGRWPRDRLVRLAFVATTDQAGVAIRARTPEHDWRPLAWFHTDDDVDETTWALDRILGTRP